MKKNAFFLIVILTFSVLSAEKMTLKFTSTATGYYPEYTSYHYDSPVIGVRLNTEVYNLVEKFGVGASGLFQLKSFYNRVDFTKFYDFYIHNFYNTMHEDKYFIYGFYGGLRYSKLKYEHYKSNVNTTLKMTRPLFGFVFASESWGFDVSWTQAENSKPVLGYEIKFRNSSGVVIQFGRRNRGPMVGADSDFYIYTGYEFYM